MRLFTLVFNIAITVNCYGRGEFPIYGGRLVSDLNGGGFSITNLAPGFAGSIGALTNAALFATPEDVADATNGILSAESDPVALPIAEAAYHAATNITAASLGALTAESDPIAYPVATNALARLKQLEQYGDADIVPSPDNWFEFSGGEITGFNYEAGREHVVIPYAIGGVAVTSIGGEAFQASLVTSIIAPKTVTTVGDSAFSDCSALTTVSFPSATLINASAFEWCTALTTVNLHAATSIDYDAFYYCTYLTSITLGKTPPTWYAGTVATATIYVPHDAIGYSDTFEVMPVIRATESADNFYLGGKTLEDRFLIKANAETIYTGAVCPASSGTQYYWTTGTNVTLSVGTLTAGKPVNIAKLNNTATNSITAIGKAGWVWTGGEMTNTITAGKSMTFGFLVDPSNGKTNAYATGVSK